MDKYKGDQPSDEDIYESALSLFLSVGWIERSERITYASEGRWDVDSSVYINFRRLVDGDGNFNSDFKPILDGAGLLLPVLELQKYPHIRFLEAYRFNGDRVWIAPHELSHAFEWMIILGCVVKAVKSGYLNVPDGSSWRPSPDLTYFMSEQIGDPGSPQTEDPGEYVKEFRRKINEKGGSALINEYDKFARHCPGFELLFVYFCYNQICLLQVDKDSVVVKGEVFSLKFTEYYDQYADYKRKNFWEKLVHKFKTLFGKHRFTYPLRRIGTSETENIAIYAPDWTVFQPLIPRSIFKYRRAKLYWEIKGKYDRDTHSGPPDPFKRRFDADVTLEDDLISLCIFLTWDDKRKQTHSRFEVFEKIGPIRAKELSEELGKIVEPDETPKEGWGAYSLSNEHPQIFHVGWGPKGGRRVQANLAFLFISFLSVCFINAYVHDLLGCIGINYWNKPTLFNTLPIVVSSLMFVYSNLQEQVPYYRDVLMSLPKYLVRVGVVCDGVAFLCGLFFGYFASFITPVMILSNVVIAAAFVLLLIWLVYNGDKHGLNRFEFGGEPTTFSSRSVQDATRGT